MLLAVISISPSLFYLFPFYAFLYVLLTYLLKYPSYKYNTIFHMPSYLPQILFNIILYQFRMPFPHMFCNASGTGKPRITIRTLLCHAHFITPLFTSVYMNENTIHPSNTHSSNSIYSITPSSQKCRCVI